MTSRLVVTIEGDAAKEPIADTIRLTESRVKSLGVVVAGYLAAFLVVCCGGGNAGTGSQVSATGGAGSFQDGTYCTPGFTCTCSSGLEGTTECDSAGNATCNCALCPEFSPKDKEAFNSCGGQVFGQWRLVGQHYVGGAVLSQTNPPSGSQPLTCAEDVKLESDVTAAPLLLDLRDGGTADATDFTTKGTIEFLHSCAQQFLPSTTCSGIKIDGVACDGTCGICSCASVSNLDGSSIQSWSTTGSKLTLVTSSGNVSYDYCVSGNQLSLHGTVLQLDFEKVLGGGTPTQCASRTAQNCTAGTGCHTGTCNGTGCTTYATEATCSVHSQCTWSSSGCAGTAPSSCSLGDFGNVPGCVFLPLGTTCTGTPKACSAYDTTSCSTVKGCSTSSTCDGPDWSCTSLCAIGYGCTENTIGYGCTGTGRCSYGKSAGSCYPNYGCTWTTHCAGTVDACTTYSVTDCTKHPGCALSSASP